MNPQRHLVGIACGLLAYGIWGFFPLFFRQLAHVSPMDVLSNRAIWACVFVGLLLTLRRQWHKVAEVFRNWRQLLMLMVAALLIGSNWLVFLWAVANRQVVASSLGYFLTPLVNVLLCSTGVACTFAKLAARLAFNAATSVSTRTRSELP